jgi:hypothetical protein
MVNPVTVGLNFGFGALTRGIDAKARKNVDHGLADDEATFRRDLLVKIEAEPGISLSELESAFATDAQRQAVLPSRLAEAQYEGLVVAQPPTTDPKWSLTEQGKARLTD